MSSLSRAALVALFAVLISGAAVAVLVGTGTVAAQTNSNATQLDANTSTVIELQTDGDARITVQTTFGLETPADTDAYRTLSEEFRNEETAMLGLDAFELAAEHVDQRIDREIAVENVTQSTASDAMVRNGTGRLAVSFTWTNFARPDTDRLYVDDVLTTDSGVWYGGLNANETLLIRPPSGFGVLTANVDADFVTIGEEGTIRWTGPATFDSESLSVTFVGNGGTGTETPSPTPANSGGSDDAILWLLVAAIIGISGLFAAYVVYERGLIPVPADESSDETGGSGAGADRTETGGAGGGEATAPNQSADDSGEVDEEADEIDEELLSDEERVIKLLEANGGRMKQADIVTETDWSNAKVSQLLSAMEEDGEINKLRIGRENLISFPEENVADIDEN